MGIGLSFGVGRGILWCNVTTMSEFTVAGTGISVAGAHTTLQPGEIATWTLTDSKNGPESIGALNAILATTVFSSYDPDPEGINSWLTVDVENIDP